jgi:hypothetical protein
VSVQRNSRFDHAAVAKRGFVVGVALFALGAVGEVASHAYVTLPGITQQLFFGMEVVGVALALFVPLVFGVVLPLVE